MSLKIDRLQLEIIINNDQARKSLRSLEDEARKINKEMKGLTEGTQEWIQKSERLKYIKQQMDSIYEKIGLTGLSMKELTNRQKELNMVIRNLDPRLPQYKEYRDQLTAIGNRMTELRGKAAQSNLTFSGLANTFNKYFAIVTAGAAAFTGMIFSIKSMISTQGDLSDSLADIRRTTGMTVEEVEKLNKAFKKLDTRTSVQDLRSMAVVAGQLGIQKEAVLDFVDSIDKMNVTLGGEIQGGAEEVAKQVGTLRNVLMDMKSANISEDLLRIGNAVNELGMAGFATAPVVIDFANRIGGVGITLGLTSDEVLGLSATLQELNVNTERGGTAMTKILQRMTTNIGEFANIAGIPVKEFTDLLNTNLFGAFMKVLEGTKRGGQSATLLAGIIKDLEVQGAGASEVFAKLGNNTEMLSEKVRLAGTSLQGTDSIMDAFQKKNENLAGDLAKLGKSFYALITMPNVNNFFRGMVNHIISLVNWFKDLPLFIEKYKIAIIAVTGATIAWIAAKTRSLQVAVMNNLTLKEGILLKIKDSVVMSYLIAKEELLTIWKAKGTIASKLAATAQLAWNATLASNPVGAVVLGITALVGAIKAYDKYNAEAIRNEKIKESALNRMTVVNSALKDIYEQLNDQIRNLNRLSIQEKIDLQEKIDKNIKLAETELLLMQARQKDIGERNTQATLWQSLLNSIKSGANPYLAAIRDANDALENGKEAASQMNEGISALQDNLKNLKSTQSQLLEITRAETIADNIFGKTQEQLMEKLSKYQVALRNTVAGSEDFVRIQNKIKETNKELAKFNKEGGDDKTKAISDYQKLSKQLEEYQALLQQSILNDPAQAKMYAEKIARIKAYKAAIDDVIKAIQEQEDVETAVTRLKSKGFPVVSSSMPKPGDMDKIENKEPLILDNKTWDEKINQVLSYADTVLTTFSSLDQALSQIENAQLARDTQNNEQKKISLKRQLDANRITKAEYNTAVEKLDLDLSKKQRKIAHDQAVRQKELAIIQATINTLGGATRAWIDPGGVAGIVLAVLIGLLGAVSIGLIASTPVPAAARGRYKAAQAAIGKYDVIGQDDGKLYRNVPFVKNFDGISKGPLLTNETGEEIVINPQHTRNLIMNYPEVINAINFTRVPQRAGGQYPFSSPDGSAPAPYFIKMDPEYLAAIREDHEARKKPLQAVIVYDNLITEQNKINRINSDTSK
jgi:TP901 family phage tail tape measure protein